MEYARVTNDSEKRGDYSNQIFDSLPENAKQYFAQRSSLTFGEVCSHVSTMGNVWRTMNLLRVYPIFSITYVNANEFICVLVNGQHLIYQGPGFHYVVGITDRIVRKGVVGENIDFGPIKVAFVRPGTLRFAQFCHTGRPLLLGPGMHHFNDINLILGNEISMNFKGDNQVIRCDDAGAFQFVFVRIGSEAIIVSRDGQLAILGPGLHFIQAPDTLKTFVSIQQEHFRFGSTESKQCFLTADNIELHINATVFYRIVDVRTMFTTRIKDQEDLLETLHAQSMATLLTIIRTEDFQGIGKRQHVMAANKAFLKSVQDGEDSLSRGGESVAVLTTAVVMPAASAPLSQASDKKSGQNAGGGLDTMTMGFQNIIHDAEPQFQRMMQSNFGASGIEIQSLRIEQIEFADKTMQKQVSDFAMTNTKLISQQQTINAQRAIQVAEAERDAATLLIKSRAETDMKLLQTEAENQIKTKTVKTDAQNKLIMADAEAQAKLRIGEAELSIMERQNAMPFAQLRIMTDAQKEVLSGVTKVVYTDQQNMLMKPFYNIPDLMSDVRQ